MSETYFNEDIEGSEDWGQDTSVYSNAPEEIIDNRPEYLDIDREVLQQTIEAVKDSAATRLNERQHIPIGIDLTSWEYAILNPTVRQDLITHGIKLFPRWSDFWAMQHPIKGINSPEMLEALQDNSTIKVIGPRPTYAGYGETYREQLEDTAYYLLDYFKSPNFRQSFWEFVRGKPDSDFIRTLRGAYENLVVLPSVEESKRIYEELSTMFPQAFRQFTNLIALEMYREQQAGQGNGALSPQSLIYNKKLRQDPSEAAAIAKNEDLKYTLDLSGVVKDGIPARYALSLKGRPTREVDFTWKEILDVLINHTNIIVINADPRESIEVVKQRGPVKYDEFSQIIRGKPTHLGTLLNYVKRLKYQGLLVIQLTPPLSQTRSLGNELTEACYVINFMQDSFNPINDNKPAE